MRDVQMAIDTGVDGLDIVIGTSSFLREHSHGKDMTFITKAALEVVQYVKSKGIEVRCRLNSFPRSNMTTNNSVVSSEDSFRSDLVDLLSLYNAVDKVGVNRVGIADTVGCASPRQVYEVSCSIVVLIMTVLIKKSARPNTKGRSL